MCFTSFIFFSFFFYTAFMHVIVCIITNYIAAVNSN